MSVGSQFEEQISARYGDLEFYKKAVNNQGCTVSVKGAAPFCGVGYNLATTLLKARFEPAMFCGKMTVFQRLGSFNYITLRCLDRDGNIVQPVLLSRYTRTFDVVNVLRIEATEDVEQRVMFMGYLVNAI